VTIFIDTAVVMYANGAEHPLRDACRDIVGRVGDGQLDGVTSAEVIQEIIHRFMSTRHPEVGAEMARLALDAFAPVLPITHALIRRVPDLARRYPSLDARDLVHVATCIHEGITEIISPDRGFDEVTEVHRIDPTAFGGGPA
jgi:predicted nucleic acid-binding protein